MLRLISVFLFSLALMFNITSTKAQVFLSAKIDSLDLGKMVYLTSVSQNARIDSLIANTDTFSFKSNAKDGDIYFLNFYRNSVEIGWPLFLKDGSNVHMVMHKANETPVFSGSALAAEQNEFYNGLTLFYDKGVLLDNKITAAQNPTDIANLKKAKEALNNERNNYYIDWINSHNKSPFSVIIIYLFTEDIDINTRISLFQNLSPEAKRNNHSTEVLAMSLSMQRNKEAMNNQFKTGTPIEDFTLMDTAGKVHSFYELKKDSYVLLDFWASWCGPCRRNNPELKEFFDKYEKDNFKIVSISADTDSSQWKRAVAQDIMQWINLSDLKGTDDGFIKEHNVNAFPTYVLISPDNKIISVPDKLTQVREFLESLFD